MNESETRAELIDPKLKACGWGVVEGSKILREYNITAGKIQTGGGRSKKIIADYVAEYDILRPDDLIVKSTGVNSGLKLYIIQNTDRKLPLEDIAKSKGLKLDELIKEMEAIIFSGTRECSNRKSPRVLFLNGPRCMATIMVH